jgi:hypothetical protein
MEKHIKIYKQHWGNIPKDNDGRSFDVHHLDGNHKNNDYWNLIAVPIHIHYLIHESQGDWGACQAIAMRMITPPQLISELAKKAARLNVKNGTHHRLGKIPWNKGLSGYKTQPATEERKKKISLANKGRVRTDMIGNSFAKGCIRDNNFKSNASLTMTNIWEARHRDLLQ